MSIDRVQLAGYLLLVGAMEFLVGLFVAESLYPGYQVGQNPISDLGATCRDGAACVVQQPASLIFTAIMLVLGAGVLAGAVLLYRHTSERWASGALGIAGAGVLGAGVFSEVWPVHGVFAFAAFFFLPLAAVLGRRMVAPSLRVVSVGLAALAFLGLGWQLAGSIGGSAYFGPLGDGGVERIIAYPALLWLLLLASSILIGRQATPWAFADRRPVAP